MEELIICSPKDIPNKESYLNEVLSGTKKRKICSIKINEKGDIQVLQVEDEVNHKYFVKIVKKTEKDCFDIINFIEKNEGIMKSSKLIKHLEYGTFFVLFFKKGS